MFSKRFAVGSIRATHHVDRIRGCDEPAKASVERTRAEVFDASFELHPEHRQFREKLSAEFFPNPDYSFRAERWEEVTQPIVAEG